MKKSKKLEYTENHSKEAANLVTLEELIQLVPGSLERDYIQSKNMEVVSLDSSNDFEEYGLPSSSYTLSHETNFEIFQDQINSLPSKKEISSDFIAENDENFESETSRNPEMQKRTLASSKQEGEHADDMVRK